MVLSECYLFPGCFLPLFIFEQRYREMLDHALKTHRMFCVGIKVSSNSDAILPITTAGIVHSCVKHEDGTSHLILMGLRRIKITGWTQEKPFRIARIEAVVSTPAAPQVLESLRAEALKHLPPCPEEASEAIEHLCSQLRNCENHELVCDILTYHFINCCETLQSTLTERCVVKRYQLLIESLKNCTPL